MRNPFHSFVLLAAMSCTLSFAQNTDHSVKRDVTKTQMSVKTTDNSVRYYNIDALNKVSFEDDKTIVLPNGLTSGDVYDGVVNEISFVKKSQQADDGIINNANGQVEVTTAKGWQESLYVCCHLPEPHLITYM